MCVSYLLCVFLFSYLLLAPIPFLCWTDTIYAIDSVSIQTLAAWLKGWAQRPACSLLQNGAAHGGGSPVHLIVDNKTRGVRARERCNLQRLIFPGTVPSALPPGDHAFNTGTRRSILLLSHNNSLFLMDVIPLLIKSETLEAIGKLKHLETQGLAFPMARID